MNVFEYMQNNPWMTFFFILGGVSVLKFLVSSVTILFRGYPPAHVNVHGEFHGDE